MKDKGPEVFKLIKTNSALDFRKNNTSSVNTLEGIIFNKIQGIVFQLQQKSEATFVKDRSECPGKSPNFLLSFLGKPSAKSRVRHK